MQTDIAPDIEKLPPDQRAVLSLVLSQGRSYAEVASMLGISEQSVRERAHAALDSLATVGSNGPAHAPALRSSKTGGALLLGALAVAVAVAAILLSGGSKGSPASQSASHTRTTLGASSATAPAGSSGEVHVDKQLTLSSPDPALKASGHGLVVSEGNRRAFYVVASGLPPSSGFFYAVWLYNSPTSAWPLGRAPNVGSNGHLEGGDELNAPNPSSYRRLVITRETNEHPTHPGEIVLSAPFALH